MKILCVADQLKFGGAERHLVALATGLVRRGHEVAVACLKDSAELAGELTAGGVAPLLCCHARGGLDPAAIARLAGAIDALRPDVLVATSQYSLMCAALARWRVQRHSALVFICHSMGVVRRGTGARLRFMVYRQFYRLADCVVFVSERQRGFFSTLGVKPARSEVIHNGIDLARFDAQRVAGQGRALRAGHGYGERDLVIGLCAVFREEKRQADLLTALARLRAHGLAAHVVLVGDGPMRSQIEACRDTLGLGDAVLLAGFQHDVRPWIAMCDVMALTSHDENFPIATLEYMALGKALVASDVGGMREQVEHGVNGLLYQAGAVDALAAALGRCADAALCRQLGQGALATVRARFGLQGMLERYEQLFQDVAMRAALPACLGSSQHAD